MLFSGTYEHSIDAKNRLAIPSQIREAMDEAGLGKQLFIAPGMQDRTLAIWPAQQFQQMADQLPQSPIPDPDLMAFENLFYSDAYAVEPDGQGRVLVPERLMKENGIERQVVITGVRDHMAIWNRADWLRFKQENQSQRALVLQRAREALRRNQERDARM